jgi:hypothetical protein
MMMKMTCQRNHICRTRPGNELMFTKIILAG